MFSGLRQVFIAMLRVGVGGLIDCKVFEHVAQSFFDSDFFILSFSACYSQCIIINRSLILI